MPIAEQREFKSTPHNIKQGHALGLLEVKQDYCAADLGSITIVGEGPFLKIDGTDILSLDMGPKNLEVSLKLFSETNELLVEIDHNEWVSGDPMPWDIETDWQKLILREKARKISISLDAKQKPLRIEGEFWCSTQKIKINKDKVMVHGRTTMGLSNLALVGGGVDLNTERIIIASGGAVVSWPNPRERLWKAHDAWKKIKAARQSGEPLNLA
jgi:hypothetical protein